MQQIEIKIQAYGAVERLLPKDLTLQLPSATLVADLLEQIKRDYPAAASSIDRCACAIGEDIVSRQSTLEHSVSLVLLSPVAGG